MGGILCQGGPLIREQDWGPDGLEVPPSLGAAALVWGVGSGEATGLPVREQGPSGPRGMRVASNQDTLLVSRVRQLPNTGQEPRPRTGHLDGITFSHFSKPHQESSLNGRIIEITTRESQSCFGFPKAEQYSPRAGLNP